MAGLSRAEIFDPSEIVAVHTLTARGLPPSHREATPAITDIP